MQQYRVSKAGRVRAIFLIITVAAIALYAAQKAAGLWLTPSHASDLSLWGLDLDTVVPALLLTVIVVAAVAVAWYIVVELLTTVTLDNGGILFKTPGFRIFYRWDEIESLDVITGPVEDAATCLQVETRATNFEDSRLEAVANENQQTDPVESYLSEADLREDKAANRRARAARKVQLAVVQRRAIRNDGLQLKPWMRLLYPQARRPDRLLLYPSLENRTALLAEIEAFLGRA